MITRRGALALGGGALAAGLLSPAHAGDRPIRIGLVGADSEGIVLAKDAMRADPNVRLVAIADDSPARAQRALSIFAHRLRKGGVHPQLDMDADSLFAAVDPPASMLRSVPLDAVLVVGAGQRLVDGFAAVMAAGVDAYVKPLGVCDAQAASAIMAIASEAAARGVVVGADLPWRYEINPPAMISCRDYPRSEGARARSFAAFLSARQNRGPGPRDTAMLMQSLASSAA